MDGFISDLSAVSYIGMNFNVMDSMWMDGSFHKRSDIKTRRVERSGAPIMRCRDCRLVRAGNPRVTKSG